jgi:hypothetical protein
MEACRVVCIPAVFVYLFAAWLIRWTSLCYSFCFQKAGLLVTTLNALISDFLSGWVHGHLYLYMALCRPRLFVATAGKEWTKRVVQLMMSLSDATSKASQLMYEICPCRGKCKAFSLLNSVPRHEDVLGDWRYSSMHSRPRYKMEISGQLIIWGKNPCYPLGLRLCGPQNRSGRLPLPGIEPRSSSS